MIVEFFSESRNTPSQHLTKSKNILLEADMSLSKCTIRWLLINVNNEGLPYKDLPESLLILDQDSLEKWNQCDIEQTK